MLNKFYVNFRLKDGLRIEIHSLIKGNYARGSAYIIFIIDLYRKNKTQKTVIDVRN